MGAIKWSTPTGPTTLLDQSGSSPNTLASLAAAGGAITLSAYDNTSNLDFWADFELNITFASSPTAGKTMDLYLMESVDGTNFADGSSTVTNAAHFIGSVPVRAVNTAQRIVLPRVLIPPLKFQILIVNSADQALATSGTAQTLKLLAYKEQYT